MTRGGRPIVVPLDGSQVAETVLPVALEMAALPRVEVMFLHVIEPPDKVIGDGEPITIDQIGAYKNDLHRRFLRDWITRTEAVHGRSLDDVWQIREECIAALGGGVYATPAR